MIIRSDFGLPPAAPPPAAGIDLVRITIRPGIDDPARITCQQCRLLVSKNLPFSSQQTSTSKVTKWAVALVILLW